MLTLLSLSLGIMLTLLSLSLGIMLTLLRSNDSFLMCLRHQRKFKKNSMVCEFISLIVKNLMHSKIYVWFRTKIEHRLLWVDCRVYELPHDKTNRMACAPSKDSDQPGHPPSLIIVFAVGMKKAWVLSYPLSAQRRLWSDSAHSHFVGFVVRQLNYDCTETCATHCFNQHKSMF